MAFHPNWKALSTVDFSWKRFVKEGYKPSSCSQLSKTVQVKTNSHKLTGDEAKKIYEDVVDMGKPQESTSSSYENDIDICRSSGGFGTNSSCTSSTDLGVGILKDKESPRFTSEDNKCTTAKHQTIFCGNVPEITNKLFSDKPSTSKVTHVATFVAKSRPALKRSPDLDSHQALDKTAVNLVMKEAERNNTAILFKYINEGININIKDQFGWTMLMCAACSGAMDAVKLLIQSGADMYARDKSGNSCRSLAKCNGHSSIVEYINANDCSKRSEVRKFQEVDNSSCTSIEADAQHFYCKECHRSFYEEGKEKHMSSTIHLFNSRPRSLGTVYGIPESNKGYQILLKRGWDKESGLGPDGSGHKFPCKTVLKRDRKGLGIEQPKPRVTHFGPREKAAVRLERARPSGKKFRHDSICKEKWKERQLRKELS